MQAVTEPGQVAPAQSREIPQGCFCSSGLSDLRLPSDFRWLGSHACDNCKLLALVDLSCTSISVIQELTFSSCVRLQHIWLPRALHTIHVTAFMDCAVLRFRRCFFFARVETPCVQRLHRSSYASEVRVTSQIEVQKTPNKTSKPKQNHQPKQPEKPTPNEKPQTGM